MRGGAASRVAHLLSKAICYRLAIRPPLLLLLDVPAQLTRSGDCGGRPYRAVMHCLLESPAAAGSSLCGSCRATGGAPPAPAAAEQPELRGDIAKEVVPLAGQPKLCQLLQQVVCSRVVVGGGIPRSS